MRLWLSVLWLCLLVGCAARRSGDAVRRVSFVGNARPPNAAEWLVAAQTDRALRNAITHPQGSWQSFWLPGAFEPSWIDPAVLDRDAWRLEIWYANHGYFDARFLGWEQVRPTRRPGRKVRPVDLVGHIEQGVPSRLTVIDISGTEGLGAPLVKRIWSSLEVQEGDIWNTDSWRSSLDAIEALLYERSFAHAKVVGNVAVNPAEHEVSVSIHIEAGKACRFGPVVISGLDRIRADELGPLIDVVEGQPYRASKLRRTREQLFALGVFAVVNILPDLSDPQSKVVPIRIQLTEGKAREVKAGPGFTFEPGFQTLSVAATYTDNNVANRLWRVSQTATIGAASNVTTIDEVSTIKISPVGSVSGRFDLPRLFGSKFSVLNNGSFGRDLTSYGDVLRAEYAPSVTWSGIPRLTPSVGYRIRFEDQLGEQDFCTLSSSRFGAASEYPYMLSMLEQSLVWDSRNDPISPSRGWYWSARFAEAGGPFGGQYDFFRGQGEVRAYRSIVRLAGQDLGTTVAGRVGGGIIIPYSDTTKVPLEERLYLGGSTTVRGWAANHLGPRQTTTCETDLVPVGGNLQLYANAELRQSLPFYPEIGLVGFVDAGRVWDTPNGFNPAGIQFSVGGGIRYLTAIGPIRLDLAWRLGNSEAFDGVPRFAPHFGLSEAF